MNTGQLRTMARDAESACNWSQAAQLYTAAADAYPVHAGSQLGERDVAQLRERARECAKAAQS